MIGSFDEERCFPIRVRRDVDVFENFRDESMKNYMLDPAWYYTSPSLAWDAMLKYTGITLNLLVDGDIDMLLMFESVVVFRMLVNDMQRQIINIWEINMNPRILRHS